MVVGFTITCAISAYHHSSCELESRSWQGVLDTTLCEDVYQWLATGRWFCLETPVSSTNKTDRHNITEILLKVALNNITLTPNHTIYSCNWIWNWKIDRAIAKLKWHREHLSSSLAVKTEQDIGVKEGTRC